MTQNWISKSKLHINNGFKLFDAEDVCRPDIWGRMFDFKTFNAEDI